MSIGSKKNHLCKINVFISSKTAEDFQIKKREIYSSLNKVFGEFSPPASVLAQAPENSFQVAVEALIADKSDGSIRYGKSGKNKYCVLETDSFKQLWGEGLECNEVFTDLVTASSGAFDSMLNILNKESMNFDNVIRQWNYIGDILKIRKTDMSEIQNYQIFNEVRHRYYKEYKQTAGFPAATGIGCRYNSATIAFNAFHFKSGYSDILIDNPLQVNPFAYDQNKLIGASKSQKVKHPPEFVRGRLISDGNNSILFVSGTASITGQEVTGLGDIEIQTRTTIQNIKTLVDSKNISRFSARTVPVPEKYRYLRVYVKHMQDIPMVKSICQNHFGDVPAIYIEADICRENLLMEIETELSC